MRWVLDTNTVIAGLLWYGPPRTLLNLARSQHLTLFVSMPLLLELDDVLHRLKFAARLKQAAVSADELLLGYAALCRQIIPKAIAPVVLDDPDDDAVLACALTAEADAIVSGDHHLLTVGFYRGIRILNAADCLTLLQSD
jgi:uncharacterized protein